MNVLMVVEPDALGEVWRDHLDRHGATTELVNTADEGLDALSSDAFDALIVNLDVEDEAMLGLADYATYRNPTIAIIVVTSDGFFSDGTVFGLLPNARSIVNRTMSPKDVAAVVAHYAA